MAAFRRVEPQHAGARALGILVPPGTRTLVILRPRSLDWDLLAARWQGDPTAPPVLCDFERDEAAQVARRLPQALADAVARGVNPVETLGAPSGRAFQVWVRAAELYWIPCGRTTGQAYHPLVFSSQEQARTVGEMLAQILWPAADADQEYYFNTQKFAR